MVARARQVVGRIFGFGDVGSPIAIQVATLQVDMRWVKRILWLIFIGIIVRPFLG